MITPKTPAGKIALWVKEKLPMLVRAEVAKIPKPKDGRGPTPSEIDQSVDEYLTEHKDELKGKPGDAGVGIANITQPQPDEMLITLTDEREKRIKLPRSRMAGGVAIGGGKKEIYVDQLPEVDHEALSFMSVNDPQWPNLYDMKLRRSV